ncbi:MAG: hypothetical protein L6R41_000226 [Letrouitia leprolyta]|nr:MAG: hypothetical protein L6R41_000226 [Letrouitia leprolyta]
MVDYKPDYIPRPQPLYQFQGDNWQTTDLNTAIPSTLSAFRLITWNIDCQAQGGKLRMTAALRYLEQLTKEAPPEIPIILFLQEMTPSDLELIQAAPWVQAQYSLTDVDTSNWQSDWYGTTTLIDRRLVVQSVYRIFYRTDMQRDGLFVDLAFAQGSTEGEQTVLRVCNTHFESLVADPPLRPAQIELVSKHLQDPAVYAGLVAGDFNAIEPFDRRLHIDNGLQDVYLELGGQEDSEEGYTWGQQVHAMARARFGCSRMDKICFCGGMRVESLERIGVGVKVEESKRGRMRSWGALEYVTDHYGLMADFIIK